MIRIVCVVDDPASLIAMRHELRESCKTSSLPWNLQFCATPEDGLIALQQEESDAVVACLSGEGMTGPELLALSQYQHPGVARVLVAGENDDDSVAKSAGVAHRMLRRPCSGQELCEAVQRVIALERRLNDPDLQAMIGEVGELPTPSATVVALNDAMTSDMVSTRAVASIIESDMNMTAKLLQLVNSAYYGLSHHMTDVHEAVAYLGVHAVRDLVVANDMLRTFEDVSPMVQAVVDELHEHALAVAHMARELARDRQSANEAYVAGLLHDVGLFVVASHMPEKFMELRVQAMRTSLSLGEIEQEIIGADHADLGAHLLDLWGLPSEVVEAVALHHDAPSVQSDCVDAVHAVHIADVLVSAQTAGGELAWKCASELDEAYLKRVGAEDLVTTMSSVAFTG